MEATKTMLPNDPNQINDTSSSETREEMDAALFAWLDELRQEGTNPSSPVPSSQNPAPARLEETLLPPYPAQSKQPLSTDTKPADLPTLVPATAENSLADDAQHSFGLPNWLDEISSKAGFDWESSEPSQPAPTPAADSRPPATPPQPSIGEASQPSPSLLDEDLPDWLKPGTAELGNIGQSPQTDHLPSWLQGQVVDPAWIEDLPDWMTGLTPEAPTHQPANAEALALQDLPDWLTEEVSTPNNLEDSQDLASIFAKQVQAELTEAEALPDTAPLPAETPLPTRREVPDWLKPAANLEFELSGTDLPPWIRPTPVNELEWLNELAGQHIFSQPLILTQQNDHEIDFQISSDSAPPAWLREKREAEQFFAENAPTLFPANKLPSHSEKSPTGQQGWVDESAPSWLETLIPNQNGSTQAVERSIGDEPATLEQKKTSAPEPFLPLPEDDSALTSWLENLRPGTTISGTQPITEAIPAVEPPQPQTAEMPAVAGGVYRSRVNSLLKGLEEMLLVVPAVQTPREAPTIQPLQVTPEQESDLQWLQQQVASEGTAPLAPQNQSRTKRFAWFNGFAWDNLLLTALFTFVLGLSLFISIPAFVPTTANHTNLTGQFYETIQQMPASGTALVVFEYAPAQAADIGNGLQTAMNHILKQGGSLYTLSTQPSSDLLALDMVRKTNALGNDLYGTRLLHLGYLSGGATGIQALLSAPARMIAKDALQGQPVWVNVPRY
jgi:hypothetical protein